MSYLRPNKRKRFNLWLVVPIAIIAFIAFIAAPLLHRVLVFALVPAAFTRDAVVSAFVPWLRSPQHDALMAELDAVRMTRNNLQKELESLKEEDDAIVVPIQSATSSATSTDAGTTSTVVTETPEPNTRTATVKKYKNEDDYEKAGDVIIKPPYSPYDHVVLAYETRSHASGTVAYVRARGEYIPIGTFQDGGGVYGHVGLWSNPSHTMLVEFGTSTAQFMAYGYGGGTFSVEVPKGIALNVGTEVRRSEGRSQIFSFVDDVDDDPAKPTRIVYFALPSSLFSLDALYVRK